MTYVNWFVERMKKTFNTVVSQDEMSYEAFDFYHEDLDDLLVPAEHLKRLPNPLLFETLSYVDDEGIEWMAGFVLEEETRRILYEVWIKNGEALAYEFYI